MFGGEAAQPAPQRCLAAVVGKQKQLVFREVEKRALEHGGEGQIVLRQQQEPAERDQILHRQLLREHQPIGPGDRHVALLQRAQQFADEGVAAAHQHHDIARPQRAAARLQPLAAREPLRDRGGDRARQPRVGLGRARGGTGRRVVVRQYRRPQLDQAGLAGARRDMTDGAAVERDAIGRVGVAEHRVDRLQQRFGGAERDLQRHHAPFLFGRR